MNLSSIENLKEYGIAAIEHGENYEICFNDSTSIIIFKNSISFINQYKLSTFHRHYFLKSYFSTDISFYDYGFFVQLIFGNSQEKNEYKFHLKGISDDLIIGDEEQIAIEQKKIALNLGIFFAELIEHFEQGKHFNHEF